MCVSEPRYIRHISFQILLQTFSSRLCVCRSEPRYIRNISIQILLQTHPTRPCGYSYPFNFICLFKTKNAHDFETTRSSQFRHQRDHTKQSCPIFFPSSQPRILPERNSHVHVVKVACLAVPPRLFQNMCAILSQPFLNDLGGDDDLLGTTVNLTGQPDPRSTYHVRRRRSSIFVHTSSHTRGMRQAWKLWLFLCLAWLLYSGPIGANDSQLPRPEMEPGTYEKKKFAHHRTARFSVHSSSTLYCIPPPWNIHVNVPTTRVSLFIFTAPLPAVWRCCSGTMATWSKSLPILPHHHLSIGDARIMTGPTDT